MLDGEDVAIGGRKDGKADGPELGALGALFGLSRDFDPAIIDNEFVRNRCETFTQCDKGDASMQSNAC
jgi:hypothetical protein